MPTAKPSWLAGPAAASIKGELNGIDPTGKQFAIAGVTIARFANGKIVEGLANWDAPGLMRQLGVVPGPAKSLAATK